MFGSQFRGAVANRFEQAFDLVNDLRSGIKYRC